MKNWKNVQRYQLAILVVLIVAIASASYAFAAANTVPDTKAGAGSGEISGYVASSVHYVLNATTPTTIDSVTFTLDSTPKAGSTIKIKIGGTWFSCTNVAAEVTCELTGITVSPATSLEAVIAD